MEALLSYLASFGLGGFIVGYCVIYAFQHPEVLERWRGILFDWLSLINQKYKYAAAKNDIQGKLNSYIASLTKDLDIDPSRVRIRWTAKDEKEEIHLEDNEVIIVIRDRGYKNINFVHAAYLYTSTTLLSHTKSHISQKQSQALDLYTTNKVIAESSKAALEIFTKVFLQPSMEDDRLRKLINQFVHIDKSGMYTHVLLQELSYLGAKTFLTKKDQAIIIEVDNLISFLETRAQREVGDVTGNEEFVGKYSSCAIKIVSTAAVRQSGEFERPAKRIIKTFQSGIENVYIIGPLNDNGKLFIENVCSYIVERHPYITVIKQDKFTNITRRQQVEQFTETYFAHLQDPSHTKYLIDDSMIEKAEQLANENE